MGKITLIIRLGISKKTISFSPPTAKKVPKIAKKVRINDKKKRIIITPSNFIVIILMYK
jgi:hypothetical protein